MDAHGQGTGIRQDVIDGHAGILDREGDDRLDFRVLGKRLHACRIKAAALGVEAKRALVGLA
jgi:hypothetical protein